MSASTSSVPQSAPDPKVVLFARGVIAILNIWPVLRIAVAESWGGPHAAEKRSWIISTIIDAFESPENGKLPDQDDLEDLLLLSMVEEYEADVDDGSAALVARDILSAWKASQEEQVDSIMKLEADADRLGKTKLAATRVEGNGDDDWEDSEDDDEEDEGEAQHQDEAPELLQPSTTKPEPIVDDDGFELVQKGTRH